MLFYFIDASETASAAADNNDNADLGDPDMSRLQGIYISSFFLLHYVLLALPRCSSILM